MVVTELSDLFREARKNYCYAAGPPAIFKIDILLEPETIASTPAAQGINRDFRALSLRNINRHRILHTK